MPILPLIAAVLFPPVVDTNALISDLVKNQFVFSGETDQQQAERFVRETVKGWNRAKRVKEAK